MNLGLTKEARANKREMMRQARIALAYQRVAGTDDGRVMLADIFDFAGLGHDLMPRKADGSIDTAGVLRNDGKRALALHIGKHAMGDAVKLAQHLAALIPDENQTDEGEA